MDKISAVKQYTNTYEEELYRLIERACAAHSPCVVLDIGCGRGYDLERLSQGHEKMVAYGVDIDPAKLKEATDRLGGRRDFHVVQGDFEKLPFEEDFFDVAFASEVIEHSVHVEKFISEARRVLKKGGVLIVTTPSKFNYVTLVGKLVPAFIKAGLRKLVYFINPGTEPHPHVREYTPDALKKMFLAGGFCVEAIVPGVLRVPVWPLFEKFPFLLSVWKKFDAAMSRSPLGCHLKANFILVVRKTDFSFKKILVLNLGGIGDVLLSVPALKALRLHYPEAAISMLVTSKVRPVAADLPYIDKVLSIELGYGGRMPLAKILANAGVFLSLRRQEFDCAINMRTLVSKGSGRKLSFLLNIIRPKIKVGRDTEGRGYFFDIKIPENDRGTQHEMEYDINAAQALGASVQDRSIELQVSGESVERVNGLLEEKGVLKDEVLIGLHPGGMPSRQWPLENFLALMDELRAKIPCKFVVTGSLDEAALARQLTAKASRDVLDLSCQLDFHDLAALIKRCQLFISNDTGPMHMAAALRTPLVALFGPGDLMRFDPRRIAPEAVVLSKSVECAPCNRRDCCDKKCLKAILPAEVVVAALDLLKITKGIARGYC